VINGVDSRSIPGLLISTLPPITLPPIRTNIETIDGKDGDIITKLGYSAYDKSFEIGLYGDYNVDDIIAFFSQEGEIVFGNEPDKYYFFSCLNQIDFARLIRYKTATVTLHIQPFKYAEDEHERKIELDKNIGRYTITVRNSGNIFSRPVIKIKASEDVSLLINDEDILVIDFPVTEEEITIDPSEMEAYFSNGDLANRRITGDYDNIKLKVGYNTITLLGAVSEVSLQKLSRWL
jgi:phage-related protein